MRGSIGSEIEARVELYRRVFAFCRQGGFSFARFLALVPERLRLALGDDARRIRIPVHVAPELPARWRALLPPGGRDASGPLHRSMPELKRVVRLAQVDPDVDVVRVAEWLQGPVEAFTDTARALYARAFAEVGRGEGGLETAYLIHHLVLGSLAQVVRGELPAAALLHPLLDLAVEAAAAGKVGATLPARLGFQLAVTTSPWSLGADGARLAERPVNAYRTTPEAIALARRVVQDPVELIALERVEATLAERQLVDPTLHAGLRRAVLMELVRDGMLLLVAQGWTPERAAELELARQVCSSATALEQHLFVRRRREQLAQWLRARPGTSKAAEVVLRLVEGVEAVTSGDLSPLGVHGELRERAVTAARGALAFVLDERTEALRHDLTALIEPLPAAEGDAAWSAGRCYRLSLDEAPLHRTAARAAEGYLLLDLSALASRAAALPARTVAEVLSRALHRPIAEAVQRAAGGDAQRVRVARWTPEQIVLHGDLVAVLELALEVRGVVARAGQQLERRVPDVLGGEADALSELEAEITRLGERLATVEGALLRFSDDPVSSRFLRDSHAVLSRELTALQRARSAAAPVEVGAYLALAEPAEVVELPGRAGEGALRLVLSRAHVEAALGASRSGRAPRPDAPFQVEVRRRVVVPPVLEAALARALEDHDPRALAALTEQWALAPQPVADDAVYNGGCAVSGPALEALVHDRRGVLTFEDRTIAPADLPPGLRARLASPDEPIVLRAALSAQDGALVHLFRAAGTLRSPGLERDVAVWELLTLDGPFVRALEEER